MIQLQNENLYSQYDTIDWNVNYSLFTSIYSNCIKQKNLTFCIFFQISRRKKNYEIRQNGGDNNHGRDFNRVFLRGSKKWRKVNILFLTQFWVRLATFDARLIPRIKGLIWTSRFPKGLSFWYWEYRLPLKNRKFVFITKSKSEYSASCKSAVSTSCVRGWWRLISKSILHIWKPISHKSYFWSDL